MKKKQKKQVILIGDILFGLAGVYLLYIGSQKIDPFGESVFVMLVGLACLGLAVEGRSF